jgi:hypothetical protein
MSALLLAAVFVAWLGLWGPVNLEKLKDWQPLMAALVALGAGSLAYRGAMAKVNLDREESERKRTSERLGLFLRLRASLERVSFDAEKKVRLIEHDIPGKYVSTLTITADQLAVYTPLELTDAWNRIDVIPSRIIENIETLRTLLPLIASELERFSGKEWTIQFPHAQFEQYYVRRPDDYLVLHARRCKSIEHSCESIIREIDEIIPRLRRFE